MTLELVDHSEFIVKTSDRQYFNFTIHWILYSCLNQPRIYGCPYTNLVILVDLVKCPLPYAPKNQSWGLRGGLGNNKSFGTGEHQSVPNLRLFGNEDETRKTLLTTGMICQLVYVGLRTDFEDVVGIIFPLFFRTCMCFFVWLLSSFQKNTVSISMWDDLKPIDKRPICFRAFLFFRRLSCCIFYRLNDQTERLKEEDRESINTQLPHIFQLHTELPDHSGSPWIYTLP